MIERINRIDKYACGMLDLQMARHPLSCEVIVIFNDVMRDHYQDAVGVESSRVKKIALVRKNTDMNYVQEIGDVLLEDNLQELPWIVSMTKTGLPRIPKMDDQIAIDGIKYTISMVKPVNRNIPSIVELLIYPERTSQEEYLDIISVTVRDRCIDIMYQGKPLEYSYDGECWEPFRSVLPYCGQSEIFVRNDEEQTSYSIKDAHNL